MNRSWRYALLVIAATVLAFVASALFVVAVHAWLVYKGLQ